jgi:menaquinone-specific isochorismate synthase
MDAVGSDLRDAFAALAAQLERGVECARVEVPVAAFERLAASNPDVAWRDPRENGCALVGWGEAARFEANGADAVDEVRRRAQEALRAMPAGARCLGAIAFSFEPESRAPWGNLPTADFVVPRVLYRASDDAASITVLAGATARADLERAAIAWMARVEPASPPSAKAEGIDDEAFRRLVRDAVESIRSGAVTKVVGMTTDRVRGAFDAGATLGRLARNYQDCTAFSVRRGEAVFLGASPERLVARTGPHAFADALAGSAPRAIDDERQKAMLFASDKDRHEHELVVVGVRDALESVGARVDAPSEPSVRTLRNVHHLWTPVRAELSRDVHVLELVAALHPTPAVSGTPRAAAMRWIAEHERTPRGLYAGAIGWFDREGDGSFAVGIRSALVSRDEAWIFVGAGLVAGSDPDHELAEVKMKALPMLGALGAA